MTEAVDRRLPEGFIPTTIKDVYRIENPKRGDPRGNLQEVFRIPDVISAGLKFDLPNSMFLISESDTGVTRGLHPEPIAKVVTCAWGEIFVALVDFRPNSPTFKQVYTTKISSKERIAIYVPPGVANSFQVLSEKAVYTYFVDHPYPGAERAAAVPAVRWNSLGIDWPIKEPILSERDSTKAVSLEDFLKVRDEGYKKYLNG